MLYTLLHHRELDDLRFLSGDQIEQSRLVNANPFLLISALMERP